MTASVPHTEKAFERLIVAEMTGAGGWESGDPADYDAELGLYPPDAIAFAAETQSKKWDRLVKLSGGKAAARSAVLRRLASQLDRHGSVHVLRNGLSERGVALAMCQLRPAHAIDPDTEARYEANRLRVLRQVRFDPKSGDSVDLVLFVNGIPHGDGGAEEPLDGPDGGPRPRAVQERS